MVQGEIIQEYRHELFGLAYRMLGSASEAEDVLQDAYLRYAASPPDVLRSPLGYFKTVVTRLCLDRLKAARHTREQYIGSWGSWLPEPMLTAEETSPQEAAEMRESITIAFLVLLETLTPQERAVFVLHEVFEYEHSEIAETLGISTANSRQILHRAKERVASGKARFQQSPRQQREIIEHFTAAIRNGNVEQLTNMLSQNITFTSDGGGKVAAARKPLRGPDAVIKMLKSIYLTAQKREQESPGSVRPLIAEVNAEPALLAWNGDELETVFAFSTYEGEITAIWAIRNPDKLHYIKGQVGARSSDNPQSPANIAQ